MKNKEWLNSLSDDKLAKFLVHYDVDTTTTIDGTCFWEFDEAIDYTVEWLQTKHDHIKKEGNNLEL